MYVYTIYFKSHRKNCNNERTGRVRERERDQTNAILVNSFLIPDAPAYSITTTIRRSQMVKHIFNSSVLVDNGAYRRSFLIFDPIGSSHTQNTIEQKTSIKSLIWISWNWNFKQQQDYNTVTRYYLNNRIIIIFGFEFISHLTNDFDNNPILNSTTTKKCWPSSEQKTRSTK